MTADAHFTEDRLDDIIEFRDAVVGILRDRCEDYLAEQFMFMSHEQLAVYMDSAADDGRDAHDEAARFVAYGD